MKQPRQGRAVQFAPFAALSGFSDLIDKCNEQKGPRRELLEDAAEQISLVLSSVIKGDMVRITFYRTDRYLTVEGTVASIDSIYMRMAVGDHLIPFSDIFEIERI